jgi:hypothetical protein
MPVPDDDRLNNLLTIAYPAVRWRKPSEEVTANSPGKWTLRVCFYVSDTPG